jgi:integrase/recombinase XerD
MLQTLLETGARASELVLLCVEDVSLVERVITIRQRKGGKRREVPIRRDLAQLLRLHIGARRAGPLFASRQEGSGPMPHVRGGRPKRAKTHGKKREHGRFSWNLGTESSGTFR